MVSYKGLIERWILPSLLEIEGQAKKELAGTDFWLSKYTLENILDRLQALTVVMQNEDNKLKAKLPNGTLVNWEKSKQ